MSKFKVWDRILIKDGATNLYGNFTGPGVGWVIDPERPNRSQPDSGHTVLVTVEGVEGDKLFRPEDAELAALTEDEEKVEAALAQTKEDLELCEKFDQAVEEARNLPLVDRLKYVAHQWNEDRVFAHFESVLNKPEYVAPEVPKAGDYVRVTYVDGTTHESEVRSIQKPGSCDFYNIHFRESRWTVVPVDAEAYKRYSKDEPHNTAVKVEQIERPIEIPEIGKWIEATTRDGKTHTFEVTKRGEQVPGYTMIANGAPGGLCFVIGDYSYDYNRVVSWKYVDAPVKPVEIDGYWVIRSPEGRVVAYLTERDAEQGSRPQTGADTVEEAEANIEDWASLSYMRRYIPLALAIIKYIENEEDN